MNWVRQAFANFLDFTGRAQRAEYWYFMLFCVAVLVVLSVIDDAIGIYDEDLGLGILGGLFALATVLPGLAVSVRRLHDIGLSGWWILLNFIPIVGYIALLGLACIDSAPGENAYGPNPKSAAT